MAKYIGLMSGTSMDGVDAVLCDISHDYCHTLHAVTVPYSADLLALLHSLCSTSPNELNAMATADRLVAITFADAVTKLLSETGISHKDICAIGSHGQTIRHHPNGICVAFDVPKQGFTCQIGDPNTLAVLTNVDVIADFRRKDIALGGQGAPLVPAFHNAVFAHPAKPRVLVNIGGIANISVLAAKSAVQVPIGYDTGPGNTLMDGWIKHCLGKPYDKHGEWAASGNVNHSLLNLMLGDSYFKQNAPKSTGREWFNLKWLNHIMEKLNNHIAPEDIQATLLELTAQTITTAINSHCLGSNTEVIICGGGAFNPVLMHRLTTLLAHYDVTDSYTLDIHPQHVEGAAFAWLAYAHINRIHGNVPKVTGASRSAVLGVFCSST